MRDASSDVSSIDVFSIDVYPWKKQMATGSGLAEY